MERQINLGKISEDLEFLKKQVGEIKEHIVDTVLTEDDLEALREAESDLRKGKTVELV
ncbi:MAG: hypothetical protein V3W31_08895 [Thermodesulfobacteriota bacterium]